jgi:hypothetical protein
MSAPAGATGALFGMHRGVHLGADRGPAADFYTGTVLTNMRAGVRWIATLQPRTEGIDEVADDPRYENLYDRFWAIMIDGSVLEHLAVAAIAEPSPEVTALGTAQLTAIAAAWSGEARRPANYGNAYANSRLLKSIAVAWSTFRLALTTEQDGAVSEMLTALAGTLWDQWFSKAPVRCPVGMGADQHSPHHASVEWSAFGVAGLALLGTVDAAQAWVDATMEHFARELLPRALAVDGAPPEGWDFWVSTLFSRAQLIDAARSVTGIDLLAEHPECVRTEQAMALCRRVPPLGPDDEGQDRLSGATWPLLPRSFGSVLLWLAARLDDPQLQALGMLDGRAGSLETGTFASAVSGMRHRLPTNCYAPLWMSPDLAPADVIDDAPVALPTISVCAAPRGWRHAGANDAEDFSAAIFEGRVHLWLGDRLVYQDLDPERVIDLPASREAGTGIFTCANPELWGSAVGTHRDAGGDMLEARNDRDEIVARVWLSADGHRARVERLAGVSRRWRTALDLTGGGGGGAWVLADPARATGAVTMSVEGSRVVRGAPAVITTAPGYGLLECVDDPVIGTLDDHLLVTEADGPAWCRLDFATTDSPDAADAA